MSNTIRYKGFSMLEALIAVVLVGLAIASLVAATSSFTRANGAGVELTTAEFLVEQIREQTDLLPVIDPQTGTDTFGSEEAGVANYDDVDDFDGDGDGESFCPPISSEQEVLNDLASYTQQVTVENVNESNLQQVMGDHLSPYVRVTVKISLNSREISSNSWIRTIY